jgi:hypothetical protein
MIIAWRYTEIISENMHARDTLKKKAKNMLKEKAITNSCKNLRVALTAALRKAPAAKRVTSACIIDNCENAATHSGHGATHLPAAQQRNDFASETASALLQSTDSHGLQSQVT